MPSLFLTFVLLGQTCANGYCTPAVPSRAGPVYTPMLYRPAAAPIPRFVETSRRENRYYWTRRLGSRTR